MDGLHTWVAAQMMLSIGGNVSKWYIIIHLSKWILHLPDYDTGPCDYTGNFDNNNSFRRHSGIILRLQMVKTNRLGEDSDCQI